MGGGVFVYGNVQQRVRYLEDRVSQLEQRIRSLRLGRRVLLNLLQQLHVDYQRQLIMLRSEIIALRNNQQPKDGTYST